jgi:tetratricopeptide repeat protein
MAASEIEKLERMVRENPKGRLFASLADAYRKDGQYPKALEVLEAGLANHPDYVSARVVLGRVHLTTGDKAKAREAFARVVTLDPESVIALKALADLAEEEGQGEEALRWSGQLLAVDPGNDEAIKQQERIAAAAPPPAPPEVRLSGIVPMDMGVVDAVGEAVAAASAGPEKTVPQFPAITSVPTPVKTVEIPVVSTPTSGPAFMAIPAPLDREPEPLPVMPLSEEAQTEQAVGEVAPMAALEPTSFEEVNAPSSAPTERMAGLDPVGLSAEEVASIGAAAGFEPNSGEVDVTDLPRSSVMGLESLSGELVPPPAADDGLEREIELELGAADANEFQESSTAETLRRHSGANEFQESSVAETLQRRSGANEFQVPSDADTLDASSASAGEAIDTGGTDLAFIEPAPPGEAAWAPPVPPQAPVFTPVPLAAEELEPAVAEPEPVVTEAMAELYSAQGHLAEALDVYRQLAARDPNDARYTDRIVELEMFVGGAPQLEEAPALMAPAPLMDTSLDEMELVPPPAVPAQRHSAPSARVTVGNWLADVFAEALPGATPGASTATAPAPAAVPAAPPEARISAPLEMIDLTPEPTPEPVMEEELASPTSSLPMIDLSVVSDVAPLGAPTRPASGSFSLTNVFGEERPGAPTAKSGSFDDFFGAAAPKAPPAPTPAPSSSGPSTRSTRPSASSVPPSDDDLSSFQDWLKGLKK